MNEFLSRGKKKVNSRVDYASDKNTESGSNQSFKSSHERHQYALNKRFAGRDENPVWVADFWILTS